MHSATGSTESGSVVPLTMVMVELRLAVVEEERDRLGLERAVDGQRDDGERMRCDERIGSVASGKADDGGTSGSAACAASEWRVDRTSWDTRGKPQGHDTTGVSHSAAPGGGR